MLFSGIRADQTFPIYDALIDTSIHHVLVRHEQGAAHMADGYARASGKVGVALATSGPGATNLVTGIATAMMDSSPTVFITGQVNSKLIGLDAFQEMDVTGITLPITKQNYLVTDVKDISPTLREASILPDPAVRVRCWSMFQRMPSRTASNGRTTTRLSKCAATIHPIGRVTKTWPKRLR